MTMTLSSLLVKTMTLATVLWAGSANGQATPSNEQAENTVRQMQEDWVFDTAPVFGNQDYWFADDDDEHFDDHFDDDDDDDHTTNNNNGRDSEDYHYYEAFDDDDGNHHNNNNNNNNNNSNTCWYKGHTGYNGERYTGDTEICTCRDGHWRDCEAIAKNECKRNGYTCDLGETCTFGDEEWYVANSVDDRHKTFTLCALSSVCSLLVTMLWS